MFIFLVLLFHAISLIGADQQPYDAIINLGGDCQSAYQMFIHGVRYYALPFDKLVTSFPSLQKILENKFEQFLAKEHLELREEETGKYILDTLYNVRFIHDFSLEKDFLREYDNIQATYYRRIERFLKLIAESKRPLFIRKRITKEQAVILSALLSTLCHHKQFKILALDSSEEIKENWNIEDVVNRYLRQPEPYDWKGDAAAWKDIFTDLGLKVGTRNESSAEI